jgi:hypothetical protein
MKVCGALLSILLLAAAPAPAETVTVEAGRDATLIEEPAGALANGSGPAFFVGRTGQSENSIRRTLLYFDVAAALPDKALIESVSLQLYMNPSNSDVRELELRRVLAPWGEGPSSASGGSGAPSEPGDATWIHTVYDDERWVHPGGQFIGRSSASREVGAFGFYTWASTNHLVQDVRLWSSAPQLNHGWILIGDETAPQSSKSFASRESDDPTLRPRLEIIYRMPGK